MGIVANMRVTPKNVDAYRLSLSLDGPAVAWDVFVRAARSWNVLLRSVDREVASGGQPNVTWEIESITKASPLSIELIAGPARAEVEPETVMRTVKALADGLKTIQSGARRPAYFSDRALESAKELAELHDKNLTFIKVRNGRATIDVTKRLSVNVDELIGPKTSSQGTVEGTLEVISIHGQHRFSIYEPLTGHSVACHFRPDQLEEVKGAFGRRVAVRGEIFSSASGKRLSVRVENFEAFPSEDDLPSIERMIGILGETE